MQDLRQCCNPLAMSAAGCPLRRSLAGIARRVDLPPGRPELSCAVQANGQCGRCDRSGRHCAQTQPIALEAPQILRYDSDEIREPEPSPVLGQAPAADGSRPLGRPPAASMLRSSYNRAYFESVLFRTKASSPRSRKRLGLILASRPGGELLEIGCGKGHLMQLASPHFTISGLELSEDATRDLDPSFRERIVIADVEDYVLPPAQYDVIVAFNVLEHLRDPASVLRRIAQALKPGGVLVGSVPLNHSLVGSLHTALTNVFDRTHCSTLRLGDWRLAFAAAGFVRQDLFGEIQTGPNHAAYIRNSLWPHLGLNLMFVLSAPELPAGEPAA